MTRDDVLRAIQGQARQPQPGEVNFPEIIRLLNDELSFLIFSGRAYQELQAVQRQPLPVQQFLARAAIWGAGVHLHVPQQHVAEEHEK